MHSDARPRHPPPALFGLLSFGWEGACLISVPFILRHTGVALPHIAELTSLLSVSAIVYFLWTPFVDVGLSRSTWIRVLGSASAALTVAAYLQPLPAAAGRFTALLFAANIIGLPMKGAIGALVCERLPGPLHSPAAGWIQAGNLGGMAIAGSTAIWCAGRFPIPLLAIVMPAFTAIPVVISCLVRGDRPPRSTTVTGQFARLWTAIRDQVRIPGTREGIIFFASPTGAAAASFLFTGIAVDYSTPAPIVALVTGVFGSLLCAAGAIGGGQLSRYIGSRFAYALCGIFTGVAALSMALAPLVPATYIVGVSVYMVIAGCGFAAYTSLSLDLIRSDRAAASTLYALFNCLGNLPVAYSIWLDGRGFKRGGPKGLFWTDAGLEIVSSLAILAYLLVLRMKPMSSASQAAAIGRAAAVD